MLNHITIMGQLTDREKNGKPEAPETIGKLLGRLQRKKWNRGKSHVGKEPRATDHLPRWR